MADLETPSQHAVERRGGISVGWAAFFCELGAFLAGLLSSPSFSSLNLRSCCSSRDGQEQQLGKFREEKEGEERMV